MLLKLPTKLLFCLTLSRVTLNFHPHLFRSLSDVYGPQRLDLTFRIDLCMEEGGVSVDFRWVVKV